MYRSTLIGLAAAIALAATPCLAASVVSTTTEDWEQAARAYSSYAFGNPAASISAAGADDLETGSIVDDGALRVDVQAFCEGEGKVLAERLYVGFCHLGH